MDWKQHIILGFILSAAYLYLVGISNTPNLPLFFGVVALGSILPDIDISSSKISTITNLILFVALTYLIYSSLDIVEQVPRLGMSITPAFGSVLLWRWLVEVITGGHRGLTHTLLFFVVIVVLTYIFLGWLALPLAIGIISHLLGDLL